MRILLKPALGGVDSVARSITGHNSDNNIIIAGHEPSLLFSLLWCFLSSFRSNFPELILKYSLLLILCR